MARKVVAENVKKARRGLIRLIQGLGAFQEDFSPLSSRSTVEVCVIPVLLYGCES